MSRLGIVMLVHTALDRAEQVARHWAKGGCPVVVHIDRAVPHFERARLSKALEPVPGIRICDRYRTQWGSWQIVAATQMASEILLREFPSVGHVYLMSGACLPLRPVGDLVAYLDARPQTDFIESATLANGPWTVDGLDRERFTLWFPFSWRKQRWLFDKSVEFQRFLGVRRHIPEGLEPHLGSQWWCLTRKTLTAILQDPKRALFDRYFSKSWIPDEAYFQTLARRHSSDLESRSLTLSKFDHLGKPHVFYDDHLHLLRRSDCFVARKIWPGSDRLYTRFLRPAQASPARADPAPGRIDRVFARAVARRQQGRAGLYMQGRYPREGHENRLTAAPYWVLQGFTDLFEDFQPWLTRTTKANIHGHIFHRDRVEFAAGQSVIEGGLSDSVALRDNNPRAFLTNLIWNTKGQTQCFQFGPDSNQQINWPMAKDAHAHFAVVVGGWALRLYHSGLPFDQVCSQAAEFQRTEAAQLEVLRSIYAKANLRVWSLAEFAEAPMEPLQHVLKSLGTQKAAKRALEMPRMVDLTGLGQFLQKLRNHGLNPHMARDFPIDNTAGPQVKPGTKPYLVRK